MSESSDHSELIAEAKALVYGLGRASGIHVVPRHVKDVLSLAMDVLASEKVPADADIGEHASLAAGELDRSIAARAPAPQVLNALEAYIRARLKRPGWQAA